MSATVRVLRLLIPALALGVVLTVQVVYFNRGFIPGDAFTYLAAGERLNDGHLLYALSPGDRPVDLKPPYWTVPLLSPPPIAVLFRPLALIPNDLGPYVWWAVCIVSIVGTMVIMLRRRPILVGLAVLVLSVPIVYEIGVGNLNSLLLAGIVGAWYLLVRRFDIGAGVVIAGMTALKLTPVVLAWWLITQRRWTAFRAFIVAGFAIAVVSLLGAGLPAHLEYLGIVRQTSTAGTSDLSLAGLARAVGVDPGVASLLPAVALVAGFVAIWLLRERPGPAYSVAIVTMLMGSPVVNVNWYTVLLAALAPLVWPFNPAVTADPAVDQTAVDHAGAPVDTSEDGAGAITTTS